MSAHRFGITINTGGSVRRLTSITLSKHGDVIFALATGDKFRDHGKDRGSWHGPTSIEHDQDIKQLRYTVHPSAQSADNYINIHNVLADERKRVFALASAAIKQNNEFFFLFSNRATRSEALWKNKKANQSLHLGNLDEEKYTLQYSVLLSRPNRQFTAPLPFGVNCDYLVVGNLRVTVLWSFISIGTVGLGGTLHPFTPAAPVDGKSVVRVEPINEAIAINHHIEMIEEGMRDVLTVMRSSMEFETELDESRVMSSLSWLGLFNEGVETEAYHRFVEQGREEVQKLGGLEHTGQMDWRPR